MKVKDLIKVLSQLDQDKEITTCKSPSGFSNMYKVCYVNENIVIDRADSLGNYNVISFTDSVQDIISLDNTQPHNVIGYLIYIEDNITGLYEIINKSNIKYDK